MTTSPSLTHAKLIDKMSYEIEELPRIESAVAYRQAALNMLRSASVITVDKIYPMLNTFLARYPFDKYLDNTLHETTMHSTEQLTEISLGAEFRSQQPARDEMVKELAKELVALKSQFDPHYEYSDDYKFWNTHRKHAARISEIESTLNTPATPSRSQSTVVDSVAHPTYGTITLENRDGVQCIRRNGKTVAGCDADTPAQLAEKWRKIKSSIATVSHVTEEDDDALTSDTTKHPARQLEKQELSDFSWISNFDVKEVATAIEHIIDYLPSVIDDREQTNVLRNDIRVLDNLTAALKSRKPEEIEQCWKICTSQGSCEHLHDEFVDKMNSAMSTVTRVESFRSFVTPTRSPVYESFADWSEACHTFNYKIVELENFAVAYSVNEAMVGGWNTKAGWLFESTQVVSEDAPPGEENWIKSNKQTFIDQYGEKQGLEVLYATAWKRYNERVGKK